MQLISRMNIRDVDLDDRTLEGLQGIIDGNRRERIAGGVDDDGVRRQPGRLDQIDQYPFMI